MAGSIADFKASFNTDLARPSRFDVQIPVPLGLSQYTELPRLLNMRCENAQLPSRTLSTTTMKVYGIDEKFPYATSYEDITLTFLVSDTMIEKKFFDAWLNWINPGNNYDLRYKKDYSVPVLVNQYSLTNEKTYSVTLVDAYPISVNQLDLNWSADGIHKLAVTFAYTRWYNNSTDGLAQEYFNIVGGTNYRTQNLLGKDLPPVEDLTSTTSNGAPLDQRFIDNPNSLA